MGIACTKWIPADMRHSLSETAFTKNINHICFLQRSCFLSYFSSHYANDGSSDLLLWAELGLKGLLCSMRLWLNFFDYAQLHCPYSALQIHLLLFKDKALSTITGQSGNNGRSATKGQLVKNAPHRKIWNIVLKSLKVLDYLWYELQCHSNGGM